jgi:endonuclease/exonuclease/phosphatase family metal-dependent hydrolase
MSKKKNYFRATIEKIIIYEYIVKGELLLLRIHHRYYRNFTLVYLLILSVLFCTFTGCATRSIKNDEKTSAPEETSTPQQTPAPKQTPSPKFSPPVGVLTYNICWECMTNSSKGSAGALGAVCHPITPGSLITTCAQNIAKLFEDIVAAGQHLDIVGLQEATRWQELIAQAPHSLGTMKVAQQKKGRAEIVTLYNDTHLTLESAVYDILEPGRPLQILIFREGLIFINLHQGHDKNIENLTGLLSAKLQHAIPEKEERRLLNHFRIIATGDFNDHHTPLRFTRFQPFAGAGINTTIKVKTPLKTCCDVKTTNAHWNGGHYGDYVLDSVEAEANLIPQQYNYQGLYSDHLPVLAQVKALHAYHELPAVKLSTVKEIGFFLVPTLATRLQLWQAVTPNNYFSTWAGPHVTLGGFAPVSAEKANQLATALKEHAPGGWKVPGIQVKARGVLQTAEFASTLLDDGASILKNLGWKNVKQEWHLTLGETTALSPATINAMTAILRQSNWEWMIALKNPAGQISWTPIWSHFE